MECTFKLNNKYRFKNILLFLILIEVFTGGGGDFYAFNIFGYRLTARIALFIVLMTIFVLTSGGRIVIEQNMTRVIYIIVSYNIISCLFGCIFNDISISLKSFLSSVYLVAYIPMISLKNEYTASFIVIYKILLVCASIIATATLMIYTFVNAGVINVYELRNFLDSINGDWWMRNNGAVAYPSQVFILIAVIWGFARILFSRTKFIEKVLIIYFVIAILSTTTRGLIITMAISLLLLVMSSIVSTTKVNPKKIAIIGIVILLVVYFSNYLDLKRLFSFADQTGGRRITFLQEGFDLLLSHPMYVFWGCGYGVILPSTGALNLEISLFEILLEQGLIGLTLWLTYIYKTLKTIRQAVKINRIEKDVGIALYVSIIAIVLLSFTNPYLNNTIGILLFFIILLICEYKGEVENDRQKVWDSYSNV